MKERFSSFSFTFKYIFALLIIAVFAIIAYFNLNTLITAQADDSKLINISGKQRMLSQKIALLATNRQIQELKQMSLLMKEQHQELVSIKMSKEIKILYFSKPTLLDKHTKKYIQHAQNFSITQDSKDLDYLLNNSQTLLNNLDLAVSTYQKEAETRVSNLLRSELLIVVLIILTLILEALVIFKPINESINKKTKELVSEKEYSDMITQINTNAIIAVDKHFVIQTFNKGAEDIFGYKTQEMIGTTLMDDRIIPLKYLEKHKAGLKTLILSGELKNKDAVFELEGQKKDKTMFPIRISFGIKIEKDRKTVVANIQDISSEKKKDSLILHQSRLAAMGEMIENIAHQWRQPLSSISTIATGAKIRYKNNLITDSELEETFVSINEHTQHLSKTIDDFKNFFDKDREEKVFDIRDAIERSIKLTQATFNSSNISIVI